jgi:hypothetical protein
MRAFETLAIASPIMRFVGTSVMPGLFLTRSTRALTMATEAANRDEPVDAAAVRRLVGV